MLLSVVSFSWRVSLFAMSSDCWIFDPNLATLLFNLYLSIRWLVMDLVVIKGTDRLVL